MARKISQAAIDKFGEDDRVITKRRAVPKAVEVKKPDIKPTQTVDNSQLIDAITQSNQRVIDAIQKIDVKPSAPEVVVDHPKIETIYIGNIERNVQNRIKSAEMSVKYEGVH